MIDWMKSFNWRSCPSCVFDALVPILEARNEQGDEIFDGTYMRKNYSHGRIIEVATVLCMWTRAVYKAKACDARLLPLRMRLEKERLKMEAGRVEAETLFQDRAKVASRVDVAQERAEQATKYVESMNEELEDAETRLLAGRPSRHEEHRHTKAAEVCCAS